jgi:hypothetical protein
LAQPLVVGIVEVQIESELQNVVTVPDPNPNRRIIGCNFGGAVAPVEVVVEAEESGLVEESGNMGGELTLKD